MNFTSKTRSALARVILITGVGEWLSTVAVFAFIYSSTNNLLLSLYPIVARVFGIFLVTLWGQRIIRKFSLKFHFVGTQFICGSLVIVQLLLSLGKLSAVSMISFYISSFTIGILKGFFSIARQFTLEKLGSSDRPVIGKAALYAMFFGPISSVILLKLYSPWVLLGLDALSLFSSAWILLSLTRVSVDSSPLEDRR